MTDIWYCPEVPVGAINFSKKVFRPDWDDYRPGLLENIKEQGLLNPLVILNNRDPERYETFWLKIGNNRMWAILELGWDTVPCIILGECEYEPKEFVTLETLPTYFRDGYPVIEDRPWGDTLMMRENALPDMLEYPVRPDNEEDYNGIIRT